MGYTIKQLRVGMNMNQIQFAKFVGMNPDTYAKKEQGAMCIDNGQVMM